MQTLILSCNTGAGHEKQRRGYFLHHFGKKQLSGNLFTE